MVVLLEDNSWSKLLRLKKKEKPLVLVIYNKNIFKTNDRKKMIWKKKEKSPLWSKKKEKRIMIFKFFTFVRKLHIPDFLPNH